MSYFGPVQILNKKVVGKKLLYYVSSSSIKKWIDYEQLTEYIPEIIEYQKSQNIQSIKNNSPFKNECFEKQHSSPNHIETNSSIKYVQFIDFVGYDNIKREKTILFKVFFANGKSQFMTNSQLKVFDMSALVKFYQNQIRNTY